MIYDKYTNNYDLISSNTITNSNYHTNKVRVTSNSSSLRRYATIYQDQPKTTSFIVNNTVSILNTYPSNSEFV
jgi:hypothetical protein